MRKDSIYFAFLFFSLFALVRPVFADYVLPYPSYMPGNKLYKISRILDVIENYWHFGAIAQTKYHLQLSDKYLVEAKTLFEYRQYLLGSDALERSDMQFSSLQSQMNTVSKEGVDTLLLRTTIKDAAAKHVEVLQGLLDTTPETFNWTPEKTKATLLNIHAQIQSAIDLRNSVLNTLNN